MPVQMSSQAEKYMLEALKLARKGIGSVEPNPAVGCIIVKNNKIIGKGWHRKFGGPHAEINAIDNCRTLGANPSGAAMYVTFEPCCHHGKTGPCSKAIIEAGLAKVVVATIDPSKHAGGKGIEQLRDAGIEVVTGLCEKQARLLNAPFIKFATTGKCWTVLKWAQTIDGKLAYANVSQDQRWISNELSRKDVQKLRRRMQGILTGINTILEDDPLLTVRYAKTNQPTRIVLDSQLRIPLDCKLLTTIKKAPVLIFTTTAAVKAGPSKADKLTHAGAEIITVPTKGGRCDINAVLDELSLRALQQVLIESGPTVISTFLKEKLADEVVIYTAPKVLGAEGGIDITEPMAQLADGIGLHEVETKRFAEDVRLRGLLKK